MTADLVDDLLHLAAESPLAQLRAERPDIRRTIEGAHRALVIPEDPGNVSRAERAALALRIAAAETETALAGHLRGRLTPAEAADALAPQDGTDRRSRILRYGDTVAQAPARIGQDDIDSLVQAGLSSQDIVAITQLAAFVPFQVRLLAGLRAMRGDEPQAAGAPVQAAAARFTMADVGWSPRLPPVEAATATPAQLAALEACPPAVRRSTYFLTLAHDPASLAERGALFNSVMYAPRGLPRAERELATAIVSVVNGCVYCTSVHARRFGELSHDPALMQRLLDEGLDTPLDPRCRAIVDFAARLTATPHAVGPADVAPLHAQGLAPLEILDLVHATAMFANANRLMQALGDSHPPR